MPEMPRVDVVIPVYRNVDLTQRCIESVLVAQQQTPHRVLVVNDASPEADMGPWLRGLHEAGTIQLVDNAANLGFAASVNKAMAIHPARDVVLLNSDTEVAGDWLDRLHRCVASDANIATATPFSNNATICSYPVFCGENTLPAGWGLRQFDALVADVNAGAVIDIPTAVGFCMYIRRSCLRQVGYFDSDRFGGGYGEENDFCMRATARGWRHVLCADVYVLHEGAASFQEQRAGLQAEAARVIDALYPDYARSVRRFCAADPLMPFRHSVTLALRSTATPVY